MTLGKCELEPLGKLLDARLRAAFEGNSLEGNDVRLEREQATYVPVDLRVDLHLSWESSWRTDCGYFNPAGSVYCSDNTDLNNKLRARLDAQIADVAEARSLESKWANDGIGLLKWDQPSFNIRPMEKKWHSHEECCTCYGRGKLRCSCAYGKQECRSCYGKGAVTYPSGIPGQKDYTTCCSGCGGSGKENCSHCGGTCWNNCRNCGAYGGFTTTKEAVISAKVSKAISSMGSDAAGFIKTLQALPIETLAEQGSIQLTSSNASPGKVSLNYRLTCPHICHGYALGEGSFEVNAVGNDVLVPLMPPVLDDVIGSVAARITDDTASPADVLRADGCRVTREILSIVGMQSKFDTDKVAATFHNTVSIEMVSRIATAITTAYNGCGAPIIQRIWIKSAIFLNIAVIFAIAVGALKPLARSFKTSDPLQTSHILVFVTIGLVLLSTWLMAGQAALKEVRSVAGPQLSRPPSQGWLPKILCGATVFIAFFLVQHDNSSDRSLASTPNGTLVAHIGHP
jgi:hypothetical protein